MPGKILLQYFWRMLTDERICIYLINYKGEIPFKKLKCNRIEGRL